jgi:DNA processing protein
MTPRRLRTLLDHLAPAEAFAVATGAASAPALVGRMLTDELRGWWRARVVTMTEADFPRQLALDPFPPAALFVRGDVGALAARRVGVIGTRNATLTGRQTAAGLGLDLAAAGVAVVSGLARGIDGAAHGGALAAGGNAAGGNVAVGRPVAIVGNGPNGPDRPYPKRHAELWEAVAERGVLMSEWPPGTPPDGFRFPMRNRILAALCEVLVVVESRERGGSLLTVREALDRSIDVMAVPGSPRNRAASGTNALLRDGAAAVTSADDVLALLGLDTRRATTEAFDPRPPLHGVEQAVVERCRSDPRTLESVAVELELELCDAAMTLARLERAGWLREVGGWFESLGSRSELA